MMRIITGRARGVRLATLEGEQTRPTSERAKEAVFSSLQSMIPSSRVLDLFAGSGQLGLEAVSRGAQSALLCDRAKDAAEIIKKNVALTKLQNECEVRCADSIDLLSTLKGRTFDLVFLDPPYKLGLIPKALAGLLKNNLLADSAKIVCESASFEDVFGGDKELENRFFVTRDAKYGVAHVRILTPKPQETDPTESVTAPERKGTLAIVPGSFDPMTVGHLEVVKKVSEAFDRVVVAVMVNASKKGLFDLKTRLEIAKLTVAELPNVSVVLDTGMLVDLYRKLGADAVCKGYRNDADLAYEKEMDEWNRAHGENFQTVLYKAEGKYANISSTEVRALLTAGKRPEGLVAPTAINLVCTAIK